MSQDMQEISLTIGDKINYPFILANAILKFQEAIVRPEGQQSEQQVRESALTLYNLIPSSWKNDDAQFKEDVDNALTTKKVDARAVWCGQRVGEEKWIEEEVVKPYRLVHACVDVLDRRGTISKKMWLQVDPMKLWKDEEAKEEKSIDPLREPMMSEQTDYEEVEPVV